MKENTLIFRNGNHENFYNEKIKKLKAHNDEYIKSLIYTLGISEITIKNYPLIFNEKKKSINPGFINDPSLTSSSSRLLRLAFNLFTDGIPTVNTCEDNLRECKKYSVSDIFCCPM